MLKPDPTHMEQARQPSAEEAELPPLATSGQADGVFHRAPDVAEHKPPVAL